MNKQLLTAVSAMAMMVAAPAIADTNVNTTTTQNERTANQSDTPKVTEEEIKQGWEDTKEAVSKTADDVAKATKETYNDIKAALINEDPNNLEITNVVINTRTTANGMIGQPVVNNGERVGKVRDIIVDKSGNPIMVIVGDGDFFGLGKLAAFDYNSITGTNAEGDVIAPLTEEAIAQAAEFSYETTDAGENVTVMPGNGYSVSKLLDGQLIDPKGKTLGQIEDIQFQGGSAAHIIVGFDQILGLGGKKAAITYDSASVISEGNDYNFQLSSAKTAQFENFKNSSTN